MKYALKTTLKNFEKTTIKKTAETPEHMFDFLLALW
jgi:hypothetical protein